MAAGAVLGASAIELMDRPAVQVHEFNGTISNETVAASSFKAPSHRISSLSELPGEYVAAYANYFDNNATVYFNPTIEQGASETEFIIKGFWLGQNEAIKDLTATYNAETNKLVIPRQPLYEYTGDVPAEFVNVNDTTADVTATIYSDGIVFDTPWGAKLQNKTNYYAVATSTIFYVPNATMTWIAKGAANSCSLIVNQSDYVVTAGNFGAFGCDVNINLKEGYIFEIPQQLTESAGTTYGDFYTAGYVNGEYVNPITGTGDETTLVSDMSWTASSTTGYWYGEREPFTITLTDGSEFVWPSATAISDMSTSEVASVKYINAQGMTSANAFDGLNIKVTTFTDGTTKAIKVIKVIK